MRENKLSLAEEAGREGGLRREEKKSEDAT